MAQLDVADRRLSPALHLALAACLAVVAALLVFRGPNANPEGDQPRYAVLGLNLAEHGTFSAEHHAPDAPPKPSLAWAGPLVGGEIALSALLDSETRAGLVCLAAGGTGACDAALPALRFLHLAEILIFLACLWWIGFVIFEDELQAWVVAALGLGFREVFEFASLVMTEPLYLMMYGLFAAALVTAYARRKGPAWWVLTGLLLGATVLVKASVLVLVLGLPLLLLIEAVVRRARMSVALTASLCILVAAGAVVGLWMTRSAINFGSLAMTDPAYLEASLSHRLAYNRMSWLEWLGGWLYFLPDFGDDAARRLFGDGVLDRLAWGADGYYHYGFYVLHSEAHALTAPDYATGYLIETYALGEPVKFSAVTALLTWRGLFVGRVLGIAGLLVLAAALWRMPPRQRDPLALLAILAFALAGVHGALSVSIPRYNLALIPVYAVSLAWLLGRLWAIVAPVGGLKGGWRTWKGDLRA